MWLRLHSKPKATTQRAIVDAEDINGKRMILPREICRLRVNPTEVSRGYSTKGIRANTNVGGLTTLGRTEH